MLCMSFTTAARISSRADDFTRYPVPPGRTQLAHRPTRVHRNEQQLSFGYPTTPVIGSVPQVRRDASEHRSTTPCCELKATSVKTPSKVLPATPYRRLYEFPTF